MKIIMKKFLIVILIISMLFPMLFSNISIADSSIKLTTERAGNYIATFAINFYNNWNENVNYGDDGSPTENSETYNLGNRSWIRFVYGEALGLGANTAHYPYPQNLSSEQNGYYQEVGSDYIVKEGEIAYNEEKKTDTIIIDIAEMMNSGKILPGDILYTTDDNYLLYVGGTKIIYALPPTTEEEETLKYEYLQNYFIKMKNNLEKNSNSEENLTYGVTKVYRITQKLIDDANILENTENLIYNGKGYYDVKTKYTGIPTRGEYEGTSSLNPIAWLIDALADVFMFIVNLVFYVVRAVIIGYVNMFEAFVQSLVLNLSGHSSKVTFLDKWTGVSPTSYAGETVTVESLFFNKLPITDANFFDFKTAGGYNLIDDEGNETLLYLLRQSLASWYVIIRNLSIAILLLILVYLGIRLAISSVSSKKAEYKKRIISWVLALGIVCFIHIFMYFIIYLNGNLVGIIEQIGVSSAESITGETQLSLYDAVRTKAYAFDFMDGTAGLIIYIMLVYLFIRFLLVYVKRALTIYILAMMGSFMGVKYAFGKASGKKTKSLVSWIREFSFNVLLQTIHCLIYTVFMTIALQVSTTSLAGMVYAIIILQFMLNADKLVMKIFGMKGGLLEDVDKPESYFTLLTKASIITGAVGATFNTAKKLTTQGSPTRNFLTYMKYADKGDDMKTALRKAELAKLERIGNRAEKLDNFFLDTFGIDITSENRIAIRKLNNKNLSLETRKQIYANIKSVRKMKKQQYTRSLNTLKNLGKGAFNTVAGVGLLAEGFGPAMHRTIKGIKMINKEADSKTARMYRRLRTTENYGIGPIGNMQMKLDRQLEKDEKAIKKVVGKQEILLEMTQYEEEVNKMVDELKANSANAKDAVKYLKQTDKYLKETIRSTNRSNISSGKIKQAVDSYMVKHKISTLKESDFDGVLEQLQTVLDENDRNLIRLDEETRDRLRSEFASLSELEGLDSKELTILFEEKLSQPNVIDIEKVNGVSKIRNAMDSYLANNKNQRVQTSDIDGILDELQRNLDKDKDNTIILDENVRNIIKSEFEEIRKLEDVVKTYMSKNGIVKLQASDFNGVLKEFGKVDENTKNRIKDEFTDIIKGGMSRRKATIMMREAIYESAGLDIRGSLNSATDAEVKAKLKEISNNMKKINSLNQKSNIKNKGAATNYNKMIKSITKKLEGVK